MKQVEYDISFLIPDVDTRLKSFLSSHQDTQICAYAMVTKHQELVRITVPEDQREEGENILIPHLFKINDNVGRIETDSNTCVYIAKEKGLIRFSPSELRLTEDGIVAEDVGPTTGDISSDTDLVIRGHVLNGYSVKCNGSLHIQKSIQDNVNISCTGDLTVEWGISGKKTEISCGGSAKVAFVERSTLKVDGDIDIKGTLFQAEVYCRGKLTVLGSGATSKSRGAVVGGIINSLTGLTLKSVGTQSCKTQLIVGVDLRIEDQLKEAEKLFNVLRKKILTFQKEVETYISAIGSGKQLQSMNNKAKELVRNKLFKLKNQQNVLSDLNEKIRTLKKKMYPKDPAACSITVEAFIDPVVSIRFNEESLNIKDRAPGRRTFKVVNGHISNIV